MVTDTRTSLEGKPSSRLGDYLKSVRSAKGLTLREVEDVSGISNAYLSQLENGKISQPNPNVLYSLASCYSVSYEGLMRKAGYITKDNPTSEAKGSVPACAIEGLTEEEEEVLLEYLAFYRTRRGRE